METIGKVICTTPLARRVTNPYTCLVLGKGKYTCRMRPTSKISKSMTLEYPFKICGQGIGETILDGFGLRIKGSRGKGSVVIEDLTIQGAKCNSGLYVYNGMNLIVRRCKVENCRSHGVDAHCADVSCEDIQVVGCRGSGVRANRGCTVKLSGENTRIEGNATSGRSGFYGDNNFYGLKTCDSSSTIHLVHPLTKEQISINNSGGGNWGGYRRNICTNSSSAIYYNGRLEEEEEEEEGDDDALKKEKKKKKDHEKLPEEVGGESKVETSTTTTKTTKTTGSPTGNPGGPQPKTRKELRGWLKKYCEGVKNHGEPNTWDVTLVTDMDELFEGMDEFNAPIDQWNTSQVTNMSYMFLDASSFNQPIPWDTSKVYDMEDMFDGADAMTHPHPIRINVRHFFFGDTHFFWSVAGQ